jgi:hypothetical protein
LEILGACFESAERSLGESKPASVEERLSGVEASMEEFGDAPGMRVGKRTLVGELEKSGEAEGGFPCPWDPLKGCAGCALSVGMIFVSISLSFL